MYISDLERVWCWSHGSPLPFSALLHKKGWLIEYRRHHCRMVNDAFGCLIKQLQKSKVLKAALSYDHLRNVMKLVATFVVISFFLSTSWLCYNNCSSTHYFELQFCTICTVHPPMAAIKKEESGEIPAIKKQLTAEIDCTYKIWWGLLSTEVSI